MSFVFCQKNPSVHALKQVMRACVRKIFSKLIHNEKRQLKLLIYTDNLRFIESPVGVCFDEAGVGGRIAERPRRERFDGLFSSEVRDCLHFQKPGGQKTEGTYLLFDLW